MQPLLKNGVPYLTNSRRGGTSPIRVVHLMASTSTASVLQTVVSYTITIKGFTPLSPWRSLMLITNSSGQTSAVWDQHQTLKSQCIRAEGMR